MTKEEMIADLQNACGIGEDGGMVISRKFTRLGAWRKMAQYIRKELGETDAKDWMEGFRPEDLREDYAYLVTGEPGDKEWRDEDVYWYVGGGRSDGYPVWVCWG